MRRKQRVMVVCDGDLPIKHVVEPCSVHDAGGPAVSIVWCGWRGYRKKLTALHKPCPKCGKPVGIANSL